MQFGFKKNHSTVLCKLVYHGLIHHYLYHGSNVFRCLIDSSQDVDRLHSTRGKSDVE